MLLILFHTPITYYIQRSPEIRPPSLSYFVLTSFLSMGICILYIILICIHIINNIISVYTYAFLYLILNIYMYAKLYIR